MIIELLYLKEFFYPDQMNFFFVSKSYKNKRTSLTVQFEKLSCKDHFLSSIEISFTSSGSGSRPP